MNPRDIFFYSISVTYANTRSATVYWNLREWTFHLLGNRQRARGAKVGKEKMRANHDKLHLSLEISKWIFNSKCELHIYCDKLDNQYTQVYVPKK